MTPQHFEVNYRPDNQWLHRKLDRKRYAQLLLYLVIGIFALVARRLPLPGRTSRPFGSATASRNSASSGINWKRTSSATGSS